MNLIPNLNLAPGKFKSFQSRKQFQSVLSICSAQQGVHLHISTSLNYAMENKNLTET